MKLNKGMTLIELLITIAIAATLASLALPSYQKQILRTYRAQAIQTLLREAGQQERYFTVSRQYSPKETYIKADGRYQIQTEISQGERSYLLRAIPLGRQAGDRCGTLAIKHTGERWAEGDKDQKCWLSGL